MKSLAIFLLNTKARLLVRRGLVAFKLLIYRRSYMLPNFFIDDMQGDSMLAGCGCRIFIFR